MEYILEYISQRIVYKTLYTKTCTPKKIYVQTSTEVGGNKETVGNNHCNMLSNAYYAMQHAVKCLLCHKKINKLNMSFHDGVGLLCRLLLSASKTLGQNLLHDVWRLLLSTSKTLGQNLLHDVWRLFSASKTLGQNLLHDVWRLFSASKTLGQNLLHDVWRLFSASKTLGRNLLHDVWR
jgi:hypothetical protein